MLIAYTDTDRPVSGAWVQSHRVFVEKLSTGWKIQYKEKEFEFKNSEVDFYPDMANLCDGITETSPLYLNWASGNSNDKSGFFSSMFRNRGDRDRNFGAFFIDKNGESHFYTRFPVRVVNNSCEITYIDHKLSSRSEEAFSLGLPDSYGYKEWNQRHRAKINSLGHISLNDAMAALEAQVDLQNRIIIKLVSGEDATEDLALLKKATDGNTVDTIHTDDKLVQTILRQKNHIRDVQKEYFATRGDEPNADLSA